MEPFLTRRNRLRGLLKTSGVEAVLITNFTNVTYLTGFSGDDSFLLVHAKGDTIISDGRYTTQISEECPGLDVYIRPGNVSLYNAVVQVIDSFSFAEKKLAIEADSLTLAAQSAISEKLPSWILIPTNSWVESLRQIKDKYEIERIRRAIHVAKRGYDLVRCVLEPDQSEIDIRNDLEYAMRKFGADDRSFNSIVAVGKRAALPHAVPTSQQVKESELLLLDWGAKCNGYVSDLTRTLVTKKPSLKFKKIYNTVLRAQKQAIEAIRPGVVAESVDRIARKIIEDAGFGGHFNHGLGHGIGLLVHESGRLSQHSQLVLQPGMIMTVEPGIYLVDWGGIRIEDDVLVTKNGFEVLSSSVPKEFEDMFCF
ncbi:MAG: M24 family metallopeptidase [Thermoguttaceae bacterium]